MPTTNGPPPGRAKASSSAATSAAGKRPAVAQSTSTCSNTTICGPSGPVLTASVRTKRASPSPISPQKKRSGETTVAPSSMLPSKKPPWRKKLRTSSLLPTPEAPSRRTPWPKPGSNASGLLRAAQAAAAHCTSCDAGSRTWAPSSVTIRSTQPAAAAELPSRADRSAGCVAVAASIAEFIAAAVPTAVTAPASADTLANADTGIGPG
mmetsp:Transcript_2461/g.7567  ORF Transcript_2461/g.7567 Transcript_2461/m.7567 type:complete len:208 (-) Transcript_2461:257-880(-)